MEGYMSSIARSTLNTNLTPTAALANAMSIMQGPFGKWNVTLNSTKAKFVVITLLVFGLLNLIAGYWEKSSLDEEVRRLGNSNFGLQSRIRELERRAEEDQNKIKILQTKNNFFKGRYKTAVADVISAREQRDNITKEQCERTLHSLGPEFMPEYLSSEIAVLKTKNELLANQNELFVARCALANAERVVDVAEKEECQRLSEQSSIYRALHHHKVFV